MCIRTNRVKNKRNDLISSEDVRFGGDIERYYFQTAFFSKCCESRPSELCSNDQNEQLDGIYGVINSSIIIYSIYWLEQNSERERGASMRPNNTNNKIHPMLFHLPLTICYLEGYLSGLVWRHIESNSNASIFSFALPIPRQSC